MRPSDQLAEFVRAGLLAGEAPARLGEALQGAGWSEAEIEGALSAWAPPVPGLGLPVPRPRPYVSARDAVLYGILFLALVNIAWALGALGFDIIDALIPDPGAFGAPPRGVMRFSIAQMTIFLPVFLWLNHRVVRATRNDPGQRRSLVRQWFASVCFVLAVMALLGDAVVVVYALLRGELTARFAAKAVLVAVIGGLVVAYLRDELDAR
ncbi:hypothetical protein GI374_16240 [Paracoccus sp. S-4012]|uniref:DUF5671 domain-containing protein n=1 Tax=Paracoccus sp. S-4012 TaxID=2665648 RepID=UPI0012AF16F9|nr:DUF5671 domain-containing protein [Paracoccus sp. S-4012]MRX51940.1 hypothetical protein [Paracoccus sp. S-4012]